jgi:hypothetical protein
MGPESGTAVNQGGQRDSRGRRDAVVAALLDGVESAPDDARLRFEAEVTVATASGRLDRRTAATLRWWHRASVRSTAHYVATAVAGSLAADDAAAAAAQVCHDEADRAWQLARLTCAPQPSALQGRVLLLRPTRLADSDPATDPAPVPIRKERRGHAHAASAS